jgi:hypothetical protein
MWLMLAEGFHLGSPHVGAGLTNLEAPNNVGDFQV